jgi:hypothetical protein
MPTIDHILTDIARQHLGIATLDPRNADSLDFHDVSVWGVKNALLHAYEAGVNATSENPGVIQRQRTSSPMFHTPGLLRALLAACRMVVDRWERGDLAEAARTCQRAIAQAETACPPSAPSSSAPRCHPRFEIEHDPVETSDRVYVLVDGKFDVAIIRTDEGVVVDVYPKDGFETIATTYAFDSEVEEESSTN